MVLSSSQSGFFRRCFDIAFVIQSPSLPPSLTEQTVEANPNGIEEVHVESKESDQVCYKLQVDS